MDNNIIKEGGDCLNYDIFHKNTFTFDCLAKVEDTLTLDDKISIIFLLYDDSQLALKHSYSILKTNENSEISKGFLRSWATSYGERWRECIIEALLIVQNFNTLKILGMDLERLKSHFLPKFPLSSVFVHPMKKALFHMCDNLEIEDTRTSLDSMYAEVVKLGWTSDEKSVFEEYFELFLLECSALKYIEFGHNIHVSSDGSQQLAKMDSIIDNLTQMKQVKLKEVLCSTVHHINKTAPSTRATESTSVRKEDNFSNNYSVKKPVIGKDTSHNANVAYKIYDSSEMGIILIINQKTFDVNLSPPLKYRAGSDLDRDRLISTWETFGFIPIVREDLKASEIVKIVKTVASDMVLPHHSAFVLCILSHGKKEYVYGSDGEPLEIDILIKLLCGKSAPFLVGKPKIVLLQACQGEEQIQIVERKTPLLRKNLQKDGFSTLETDGIPENSDLLIFYSTAPGYLSYRDILAGSWFIQILCDELEKEHGTDDIVSIFIHVNRELSRKQEGRHKQMPIFYTTFTKKLYLTEKQ